MNRRTRISISYEDGKNYNRLSSVVQNHSFLSYVVAKWRLNVRPEFPWCPSNGRDTAYGFEACCKVFSLNTKARFAIGSTGPLQKAFSSTYYIKTWRDYENMD